MSLPARTQISYLGIAPLYDSLFSLIYLSPRVPPIPLPLIPLYLYPLVTLARLKASISSSNLPGLYLLIST